MLEFRAGPSRVVVARGLLDAMAPMLTGAVSAHRATIVTDTNVGRLYAARVARTLAGLDPVTLTFPAGERHKTRATWASLTDEMLAHGVGRDSVVIALGGGVAGDIGGFVAATYMRGVPVVQVPTSLVAMIDASIGGKTGVDTPEGKNLVGAFHPPALVVVDPDVLDTLPPAERRAGLAEALKHGVIADATYFASIVEGGGTDTLPLVSQSIAIKARLVTDDPLERGARKMLNFGHTLAHAIEAASDFAVGHGDAVAIGMVLEARIGEAIGATDRGTAASIADALGRLGLPTRTAISPEVLIARTGSDKKRRHGRAEYSLPRRIGQFDAFTTAINDEDVVKVLRDAAS